MFDKFLISVMTVFIATTPSYGHPSGLPPAPPEGEGRKKEGTTQDASVKLYLGIILSPLSHQSGLQGQQANSPGQRPGYCA